MAGDEIQDYSGVNRSHGIIHWTNSGARWPPQDPRRPPKACEERFSSRKLGIPLARTQHAVPLFSRWLCVACEDYSRSLITG